MPNDSEQDPKATELRNDPRSNAVRVPLTQGKYALVSPEDYQRVSVFSWYIVETKSGKLYAVTYQVLGANNRTYLHRFILGVSGAEEVDHRDGDGLHDWRENLRLATHHQNTLNKQKTLRKKSSRFRGVCFDRFTGRWYAKTTFKQRTVNIGRFDTEEEAAAAFDDFARLNHGEFANLNFPL